MEQTMIDPETTEVAKTDHADRPADELPTSEGVSVDPAGSDPTGDVGGEAVVPGASVCPQCRVSVGDVHLPGCGEAVVGSLPAGELSGGGDTLIRIEGVHPDHPVEEHHWLDDQENPAGGGSQGTGFEIVWQDGPLVENGRNGAFVEDVLKAVIGRLEFYERSKYA